MSLARLVLPAIAGAIFGLGLVLAGMTDPARVVGFLDIASGWDPSLAFVMGGAVLAYAVLFRWICRQRREPWFDSEFHLPTQSAIDRKLIVGAAVFGIGWGLGGLCPGPSIVSAASGNTAALAFVAAMLLGMHLQHRTQPRSRA